MTVIDHNAFPHIMEEIFRCADFDTLVKLRGTARKYRDWADSRLSEHLVVHVRRMKSSDGDPASQPRRLNINAPGGRRLPFFRSWDEERGDDMQQWQAFDRFFAHTTILDMADESLMPVRAQCIAAVCPKLQTLRMLNNYESERGDDSQSAVIFPGQPDGTFVQFSYAARALDAPPGAREDQVSRAFFINPIPRRVRRCVVNLLGDLRDDDLRLYVNATFPPELKELVLVFHPEQGPNPESEDGPDPMSAAQRLVDVVQLLAKNTRKVKIIMAGALGEQEPECRFIGAFDEVELRNSLVDIVATLPGQPPMAQSIYRNAKAAARDVKWQSMQKYKKSLRPTQWETECVPRPWFTAAELSWVTG